MLPRGEATVGRAPALDPPRRRRRSGPLVTGSVTWLQAGFVALVTALVFWLPGALVLQGWGWRLGRLGQLAVAPLVTCGLFGGAALFSSSTLRWDARTALVVTLLAWGAGLLWRRLRAPGTRDVPQRRRRIDRGLIAIIGTGVAVQLVAFAAGAERPDGWLAAHDVTFHLAAVEYIRRTGLGSSLQLAAAATADGSVGSFYGGGWHDVAALVPVWPWRPLVLNATIAVPIALAWVLGITFLCRTAVPNRPRAALWAPLLGSAGVAVPLTIALYPEGMVPNAFGLALAPALISLVVLFWRKQGPPVVVVLLSVIGVALVHPNALATVALALAPAAGLAIWHRRRSRQVVLASAAALVALAGLLVVVSRTPQFRAVTGYPAEPPIALPVAVTAVLSGNATGMGWATGYVVVVAGMVGTVIGWRVRGARWQWLSAWVFVVFFLAASSSIPYLRDVDRLWYGEPRRFTPMIGALFVPPACMVVDGAWRWTSSWARRRSTPRWLPLGAITLAVTISVLLGGLAFADLVRSGFDLRDGSPPLADAAELDLAARLDTELDHSKAVLGSPFSGATNLAARNGQRVEPPAENVEPSADLAYVRRTLDRLGEDPELCAALRRLDVGYVYVDTRPWNSRPWIEDARRPPARGVQLVDAGGTASVYAITAC